MDFVEFFKELFWFLFWLCVCDQFFLDGAITEAVVTRIRGKKGDKDE